VTVRFLAKAYQHIKQTMAESNMWGGGEDFACTWTWVWHRTESYGLFFNEEELKQSTGFRVPWSIDFSQEQLSTRWRESRFGWISRPELNESTDSSLFFIDQISRDRPLSKPRTVQFSWDYPDNLDESPEI
jgi:hypothetical protein